MPDQPDPNRFRLTPEQAQESAAYIADMIAKGYITPAKDPEPEPPRPSLREPESVEMYLDADRFPVTTRPGMTFAEQKEEDFYALKEIREFLEDGGKLSDRRRAELVELLYKVPIQHRLPDGG